MGSVVTQLLQRCSLLSFQFDVPSEFYNPDHLLRLLRNPRGENRFLGRTTSQSSLPDSSKVYRSPVLRSELQTTTFSEESESRVPNPAFDFSSGLEKFYSLRTWLRIWNVFFLLPVLRIIHSSRCFPPRLTQKIRTQFLWNMSHIKS